ncbi:hypothetical protein WDZ17_08395 [Pseudokineococcus basanitobsidens]|uniref:Oligosaccharide repeat unit polymerase n=1 Tax=Pseudokineococcus basanitobsidens TaxID=1926649 RepID=A0ABU8RJN2_9ACTN
MPEPRAAAGRSLARPGATSWLPGGLWWVSPVGAIALIVPASLWYASSLGDETYRLLWRTPKVLTGDTTALAAAAALAFVAGAAVVRALARRRVVRPWPGLDPEGLRRLEKGSSVVFWLTAVGYLAFAAAAAARGLSLSALVRSVVDQDNYGSEFREQLAPVPGVTTLTQCGLAYVAMAGILLVHRWDARTARRLGVVLLLALVRSFVNTERLALLELLVPLVVVGAVALRRRGPVVARRAVVLAPVVLLPVVVAIFGAFEYSRSWQFFQGRTDQGFWGFVLARIAGYYATAYNNGAIRLDEGTYPGRLPYESVQLLWDAPGVSSLGLYERWSAATPLAAQDLLERFGNPEFNNPGGLTVPLVDLGVVGGLVYLAVAGVLIGLAYQAFVEGRLIGLLLYPIAATGAFELPRYVYWSQGRVLPAVLCVVVVTLYVARAGRRRPAGRTAPAVAGPRERVPS